MSIGPPIFLCTLRNGTEHDGEQVLEVFNLTHAETDFMLTYPDENSFIAAQESDFLKEKTESKNEIEIVAEINGKIVGTAGIDAVGGKFKISHRADFGIGILKEYWGLGIGSALTDASADEHRRQARFFAKWLSHHDCMGSRWQNHLRTGGLYFRCRGGNSMAAR